MENLLTGWSMSPTNNTLGPDCGPGPDRKFAGTAVLRSLLLTLIFLPSVTRVARAQELPADLPQAPPPARSIDDLNLTEGDASMPTFEDSMIDVRSAWRQKLFQRGVSMRVVTQAFYSQNALSAPVAPNAQTYIGQRAYESWITQPIFVADLRQLHLRRAQLYMGGVWNWVTWNPAGPKTIQLWDLYFYKSLARNRVQLKTGYISMNLEFVGLFVGGSSANGGQGVYAVLPYEVGMSYFPLTAPAVLVRLQGPHNWYLKSAAQRSLDPNGGPTEVARNATGFRFDPHGDKLLSLNEAGYLRDASTNGRERWLRMGYFWNATRYTNVATGAQQSGNYCTYILLDGQITQPSRSEASDHGFYAGASFMAVPGALNDYSRYEEFRMYEKAPFRSRPADLVTFVASHTSYSRLATNSLVAQGKSVWRGGSTFTGGYALHAGAGNYIGAGLSYLYGPAITPHVPNALTFTVSLTNYF